MTEDILERISAARVLETFREESSLDYSPSIYTMTQDGEPISDWLFESQVDPKDVGLMDKLLDKVFDDLAINITQKKSTPRPSSLLSRCKDWVTTLVLALGFTAATSRTTTD